MAYSLSTHYAGQGLLDGFNFFTGEEPNNGFVDYKSREEAVASNLVSVDKFNRVRLGVDSINTYSTSDKGRPSVRITSNDAFTHGLFIADFAHMPSSTCGTWPAFWAFNNEEDGTHWPTGGEIDIIEGANTAETNLFSAHTTPGCRAPITGFTGSQEATDCSLSPGNIGCNYAAPVTDSTTYGDAFNAEGGGVYALEWDSQDIKIWHFPRTAIPNDIKLAPMATPDPTTWGPPQALFGGSSCEADSYFFNMSLVINTNFCGAYAGNIWGVTDKCNELAPTCEEYVASNPSSFINAFWQINYIDIYKKLAPVNSTLPPLFPNSTTLSSPPSSAATSPLVFGNSTTRITRTRTVTVTQVISTAEPTRTGGGLADPATINGWTLLGCFGSPAGYESFSPIASFSTMDNEACVASCTGHKYAGVSGETCYCADTLGDATAVANEMCTTLCPGNPHEICGGVLSTGEKKTPFAGVGNAQMNSTKFHNITLLDMSKPNLRNITLPDISKPNIRVNPLLPRAAPSNILLTVYGNINGDVPPSAPGMGGNSSKVDVSGQAVTVTSAATVTSAVIVSSAIAVISSVVTMSSVVTVTFTTICPTDAGRLVTLEYCTTLTAQKPCQLCAATAPAVPMTTCTEACNACGPHGESTVTLTVPSAVAAGTGSDHVVAVAVQTVVPVIAFNASSSPWLANASYASPNRSAVDVPVVAAGTAITVDKTTAGFLRTLGYGFVLWFAVFWVGTIL
ncbi:glycoside hydrolase family 16 protein [Xylaria longipes]|nr:glycoside hydrolase family 16 protein [Xylaria longipes]